VYFFNLQDLQCACAQVGGLLDSKGYGIATRPGTPFKPLLDQAILKLMEGGTLHRLRVKWWKQKRGGGACDAKVRLMMEKNDNEAGFSLSLRGHSVLKYLYQM